MFEKIKRKDMLTRFKDSDFGRYVYTGIQAGGANTPETMIGKLIQVRLEAGDFGSDVFLLRHHDEHLSSHANQCLFTIDDEFKPELDEAFKNVEEDDPFNEEHSISGKEIETGFIIPSKIKPGESTPMRDIKGKINDRIDELLSKDKTTYI